MAARALTVTVAADRHNRMTWPSLPFMGRVETKRSAVRAARLALPIKGRAEALRILPVPRPLNIGVFGALGRMGQAIVGAVNAHPDLNLAAQFGRPGPTPEVLAACAVIIDFSSPAGSTALSTRAAAQGGPALVIGTTGSSAAEEAAIAAAARSIAIVRSGNFSLGVNVLAGLVEQTARRLNRLDWDIEITEAHHRRKVDAPSGTALSLAEAAARGRGEILADITVPARDGRTGPRPEGAIGFSVVRGGGIVGEHSVIFAAEDEILTLSHSARDRGLFAKGALQAALWLPGKPPGLYDMLDVLGFRG